MSLRNSSQRARDIWYREPMVWLLILFPAVAVIGGAVTFYLAVSSDDGLVKDDYYQQGKQINRLLARDEMASQLKLTAELIFNPHLQGVRLKLKSPLAIVYPEKLTLGIFHRTRPGHDRTITLIKIKNGLYQGQIGNIIHGRYNLELSAQTWRLMGFLQFPSQETIYLNTYPAS